MYGIWLIAITVSFAVLTWCFPEDDLITLSKYACDTPPTCHLHMYSIECSMEERIAIKSISYGTKPVTSACPANSQTCIIKTQCCHYEQGDCLTAFKDFELFKIYEDCSFSLQCGWLFASSIPMVGQCKVRNRSNYIKADFTCVNAQNFIDACSQLSVTAKSVHIHHSAMPLNSTNSKQCSCIISPNICNTTATVIFHAVDVRLHNKNNLSSCSPESRIELVGQRESKIYSCEEDRFLHGFEVFHISKENNVVLYLHKLHRVYPTKMWLQVKASLSEVNVKVTCGARSVETATRCPALPIKHSDLVDVVQELPNKNGYKPTIMHLNSEDIDEKFDLDNREPSDKQNTVYGAIIGGVVAVVIVGILLSVVCIVIRKRKRNKEKQTMPSSCIAEVTNQINYYEAINDQETKVNEAKSCGVIYHQPWGDQPGVSFQGRAKPVDLAYATSEEIKVLIEKMAKDNQHSIMNGEYFSEPDPIFYRHISSFTFISTDNSCNDGTPQSPDKSEGETDSLASDNCNTEKIESEDSKVEADRYNDSDVESHRIEAEGAESGYDGYESPRVNMCHLSNAVESVQLNRLSNQSKLKNYVYQPETVCINNCSSEFDVPDKLA